MCGAALKTLAGKLNMDYDIIDEDLDEKDDDIDEAELAETKVKTSENDYGAAYTAFGGGTKGHEACHAIAALCEVCSIDSLISNFILPLQVFNFSCKIIFFYFFYFINL